MTATLRKNQVGMVVFIISTAVGSNKAKSKLVGEGDTIKMYARLSATNVHTFIQFRIVIVVEILYKG